MITAKDTVEEALRKAKAKKVYLEGNFVKILSKTLPADVKEYVEECKLKDKQARRKRLDVTKQVQAQNKELEEAAVVKEEDELLRFLNGSLQNIEIFEQKKMYGYLKEEYHKILLIAEQLGNHKLFERMSKKLEELLIFLESNE